MSGPTLVPPRHQAIKVLRRVEGERLVVHTRRTDGDAADCATLVLLAPVPLHFENTLKGVILRGRGSIEGLPAVVSRTLEGFRVRARVGEDETGIAEVVDAGVLQVREGEGLTEALPPPGHGYVWASTAWVPGETLDKAWADLDRKARADRLQQVAANLATLHRYGVCYGDLKPGNVVIGDDATVLIDLETMREVPGVDAPVRSLEYTPGYASPEQVSAYEAYLTSDVWAFGALAASLWLDRPPAEAVRAIMADPLPEPIRDVLPPRWAEVIRACLRPIPHARPRAAAVAAVLRGENAGLEGFMDPPSPPSFGSYVQLGAPAPAPTDETTRVEDPEPATVPPSAVTTDPQAPLPSQVATLAPEVPVGDIVPDPSHRPPARSRPLARLAATALLVACLLGLAVRLGLPGVARTAMAPATPPQDAIEDLHAALQRHKTDPDYNGQDEIDRILVAATAAVARDGSPDARGLRALAYVWSQRWHYSTATWDAEKWARTELETREAGPTVEGRFARAMAMSAACRLMPATEVRSARCDEAERLFERIGHGEQPGWLAVEVHWAAEVLQMHLILRALRADDEPAIAEHTAIAHGHCEAGWPLLDEAPVNGDEMNEDCIAISGWAGDYPGFLAWSDRLLRRRDRTSLQGAYPEVAKIFRGGSLACTYREVDDLGLPENRSRTGSWEHFCDVIGLAALGCVVELPRRFRRSSDVPWTELRVALQDVPRRRCLLDADPDGDRAHPN